MEIIHEDAELTISRPTLEEIIANGYKRAFRGATPEEEREAVADYCNEFYKITWAKKFRVLHYDNFHEFWDQMWAEGVNEAILDLFDYDED